MCIFSEEEEDEDTAAPPPVEDAHEEKDEQDEQQEEGKSRNASLQNSQTRAGVGFLCEEFHCFLLLHHVCIDTPKELTEEEKLQVLHSEEFVSFFERGSRIVERALAEQVDVCFDYSGKDLEDKEG